MKKKRHSVEQITAILKQAESGAEEGRDCCCAVSNVVAIVVVPSIGSAPVLGLTVSPNS